MMNGPFFRNYSTQQPSRSVPVQQTQQKPKPSPKVISVPIHFISSDQPPTTMSMLKDSAAIKIQKLFRGFAVRKSVKKIDSIRHEVTEIERRINNNIEVVNLIRGDAKERLRVNETLMALLFKLDSIRGVDSGVRDLRKAVTRKAIALQEKVDSIAIAKPDHQTLDSHSPDKTDIDNVCTSTSDQVITKAINSVDEIVNHEVILEAVDRVEAAGVIGEVECMETAPAVNSSEIDDVQKQNYGKEKREILENLMDDNEQMMRLMKQISERNEMQTRMINDLSRRVEQLEKAEKLRKKRARVPSRRRMRDKDSFCI